MNRAQRRNRQKANNSFVVDYSWRMIFAAAGIVLHKRGMDDDQIGDILEAMQAEIDAEVDNGGTAATMIDRLTVLTGIQLMRGTGRK